MAQNPTPEIYLSLLSGRRTVPHITGEECNNDVRSRLSDHPSPIGRDPDRLMDILDAIAAICIHKPKAGVFFVSLSVESNGATLYVASNKEVPLTVISHLYDVRVQLKKLKAVIQNSETSPDSNNSTSQANVELELQTMIYAHSYSKLRQRCLKRAPAILGQYHAIMKIICLEDISKTDADLLNGTYGLLRKIQDHLEQSETPPFGPPLDALIETIDLLSRGWRGHLRAVGNKGVLSQWENATRKSSLVSRIYHATCHNGGDSSFTSTFRC